MKKLLQLKQEMRAKRPRFVRQEYLNRIRIKKKVWRKPKGRHSKMRERRKSKRPVVQPGYRSPSAVRHLHKTGVKIVYVRNPAELELVKPKECVVVIQSTLGARKKYDLAKKAIERNIAILNFDAKKFVAKYEARLKEKQAAKETAKKPKGKGPEEEKEKEVAKPKEKVADKKEEDKIEEQKEVTKNDA